MVHDFRSFVLFIVFGAFLSGPSYSQAAYSGASPYRLLILEHVDASEPFDPNQDILAASPKEIRLKELRAGILSSVAHGLLPMKSVLNSSFSKEQGDLFSSVTSMAAELSAALSKVVNESSLQENEAFESSIYLLPFQSEERNLFYKDNKLSMESASDYRTLGVSRESKKFEKTVTQQVLELQRLRANAANPVFLLGLQATVSLRQGKCSSEVLSCLLVEVVLAVKPTGEEGFEFTQENEKVAFEKIVVPGREGEFVTAKLNIEVPLQETESSQVPATLRAEFGQFEKYSEGSFQLESSGRQNWAPGMQGRAKVREKNLVPLTFSFSDLVFDLEKQELDELSLLTSLGFISKRGRLPIGGFKVSSVNTEFQNEINNTINEERTSLEERVTGGEGQYSPILKQALESILRRL